MSKINGISAVLIIRNEEAVLDACLRSLAGFSEVVVYLNGCTDRSESIARRFLNTKVVLGEFDKVGGFGATRNAAASHATNDWIMAIDADETLSPALADELARWDLSSSRMVGWPLVVCHYMGTRIRFGCGRPRHIRRLYNRQVASWSNVVHEDLVGEGLLQVKMDGEINHMEKESGLLKEKAKSYAKLHRNAGVRARTQISARGGAFFHFIKFYIFQGGLLHGKVGFSRAWLGACWHYEKYNDRIRR